MLNKNGNKKYKEYLLGYLMIFPAMLFVIAFIFYPMFQSLSLSFFKWNGMGEQIFVGFKNYIKLFTVDRFFNIALKNTIYFSIGSTAGTIFIGFILAVFIDLKIRFWRIYRIIFFITYVLSIIVVALLWIKVFDPRGIINTVLEIAGHSEWQKIWLGDPKISLSIITFVAIWQYSGFPMIFFLAGMQNIDEGIYEAAIIDGASTGRRIISITLPLLKNVFSVIVILQIIYSFKVFDLVYVMTMGGPSGYTEVLGTLLYKNAFRLQKFGYASTISVVVFVFSIIIAIIYIRVSGYQKSKKG